jgi:hypothetical protein
MVLFYSRCVKLHTNALNHCIWTHGSVNIEVSMCSLNSVDTRNIFDVMVGEHGETGIMARKTPCARAPILISPAPEKVRPYG